GDRRCSVFFDSLSVYQAGFGLRKVRNMRPVKQPESLPAQASRQRNHCDWSSPMSEHKPRVTEIDDIEDRMGSMRELDFSEHRDERQGRIGDERPADEVAREFPPEREARAGMSGGEALSESVHEDNVTLDDLSPETLIDESGAYSPGERGEGRPADKELSGV